MTALPEPEFSFLVDVTSLPQVGRHYAIKADEAACARVAERLGLQGVASLSASFDLTPHAGGIVKVTGFVAASLTQTCGVTLAPVPATLKEAVDVSFTTLAPPKAAGKKADFDIEELVALGAEDPPEEALGGHVDLGELAVVHLALGLDPYPRAPGAAFKAPSWVEKDGKSEAQSPFAVLAKFKKQDTRDEGP